MTTPSDLPTFHAYVEPTLEVLRRADGAMQNAEIERAVVKLMGLSDEAASQPHDPAKPGRSEVGCRSASVRTALTKVGSSTVPRGGRGS